MVSLRNKNHDEHDEDHDALFELTRVAFIGEAEAIRRDLESLGIPATVFESDAGGWAPYLAVYTGNRVMVRARDVVRAREVLSDDGGQLDEQSQLPAVGVRKHLRRHGNAEMRFPLATPIPAIDE